MPVVKVSTSRSCLCLNLYLFHFVVCWVVVVDQLLRFPWQVGSAVADSCQSVVGGIWSKLLHCSRKDPLHCLVHPAVDSQNAQHISWFAQNYATAHAAVFGHELDSHSWLVDVLLDIHSWLVVVLLTWCPYTVHSLRHFIFCLNLCFKPNLNLDPETWF